MKTLRTVLVIEDDSWFAKHHMRTLEGAGFRVRQAPDAIAGIAAIDEDVPDAVVLDMFLPGPNALVLLHEMQSYSDLAQLPIILCSNSSINLMPDALAAYGVAAVLDKGTMQPQDLVAAVRRVLL